MLNIAKLSTNLKKFLVDSEITEISIGCSKTQVYEINKDKKTYFLKIGEGSLLTKEYTGLMGLKGRLAVPNCCYFEYDGKNEYLVTTAVSGEMSCSDKNLSSPEHTIKLLAKAILLLNNLDITNCPFRNDLKYKLGIARYNVENNLLVDEFESKIGKQLNDYAKLLEYLEKNKSEEELVFSHGDTSLPNIFFDKNDKISFIDLGECGVADRWFDIAICYKSIRRNFPNRDDLLDLFLAELGEKYSDKIDYYIAIMDLYL